ncbi:MAG: hypothetical protein ACQERC_02210 [Bacteroidota bacterium]
MLKLNLKQTFGSVLVVMLLFATSNSWSQQTGADDSDVPRTSFSILVENSKEFKEEINISTEILNEIAALRLENEDRRVNIGEFNILIMSHEKMENGVEWPKYSISNK